MHIAIIGGGPAGLRAAEMAAAHGDATVSLYDAKASVGRKFLVAGKGGLNLTKAEERSRFIAKYSGGPELPAGAWESLIGEFDSEALRAWAAGLGVETFVASTGRVYPRELKAAPLLRRWVERLRTLGVRFFMHHRLTELRPGSRWELEFDTSNGPEIAHADAVILALGGGSWPQTGSTGAWTACLEAVGVEVAPLMAANCGWEFSWPAGVLEKAEGQPLKSIAIRAGDLETRGELLVTRYGLEGGALYALGAPLRAMEKPAISIDFKPTFSAAQLIAKMGPIRRNFLSEARQRLKLGDAACAIIGGIGLPNGGDFASVEALVESVKNCRLDLQAARPIEEAISSAGGVRWGELDERLMVKKLPGLFVAGEMIDWEAPTGGYLIQGCFATGTRAGTAARQWATE